MAKMLISLAITVGGAILSAALAPKPKDQFGPRLSDINVGTVSPGNPIIRHWGTMKLPGQLIWTSKIIETEHDETVEGGKFQDDAHIYTYTYSVDCAVAVCKGPVYRINRIWANQQAVVAALHSEAGSAADFRPGVLRRARPAGEPGRRHLDRRKPMPGRSFSRSTITGPTSTPTARGRKRPPTS